MPKVGKNIRKVTSSKLRDDLWMNLRSGEYQEYTLLTRVKLGRVPDSVDQLILLKKAKTGLLVGKSARKLQAGQWRRLDITGNLVINLPKHVVTE